MAETALPEGELWDEFHRVVNMSSRELADWLHTRPVSPLAESLPNQAGTSTGQHVLHILTKCQTDLNSDDLRMMRKVVQRVHAGRQSHGELVAGRTGWRHRLMSLGHDPLKPA